MSIYYSEAQTLLPDLIRWRRKLHQHAEGGYDLPETLSLIRNVLQSHDIAYSEPCESVIVCDIGQGPCGMILRADMDALPMQEESGLDFASQTGWAHTCGHDIHTTALLGAACLLKAHETALHTRTRLVFQPNEEGIDGARHIMAHGLITPDFQGAFALHVSPTLESGIIYYQDGPLYASGDAIRITITGSSAHGAAPHTGRDPIFAGVQLYNALQGLISRETPSREPVVLSICAFNGGNAVNVVPGRVELLGTLRAYNEELRAQLKARLQEICESIGKALRCQIDLSITTSVPAVINDAGLNRRIRDTFALAAPDIRTAPHSEPFSWSEDFGLFAEVVPISMMTLGAHVEGCTANIHNADVLFDESALVSGVCAHVCAALSVE